MTELIVPPLKNDGDWPSLGSQVADWQEANLAFGPGDLLGRPYATDDEDRAFLERAYQVYGPRHSGKCRFNGDGNTWRCTVGDGLCGRRRFDQVVLMLRKGLKKSERAAACAVAELADDSPVRCDGFRRVGGLWEPVGRPVTSPFVFIFAFAKEQAEDTSFDAMKAMIEKGPGSDHFQVWDERILRRDGEGEAKAMASAPDSRDGGKTTFQVKEEAHRWTMPRHHEAHRTTLGNLSKRPIAEPWEMFPTTAYAPGEGSVAEQLHAAALKLDKTADRGKSSRMFFFYRWADTRIQLRDADGSYNIPNLRHAILDATGETAAKWSDPDGIMSLQFLAPASDQPYAERVWLNRTTKSLRQAFDPVRWTEIADPRHPVPPGSLVVLSWHGARYSDAAALIATEIATGYQWPMAIWEHPDDFHGHWEVPNDKVDLAVANAFDQLNVWKFYINEDQWQEHAATWKRIYGEGTSNGGGGQVWSWSAHSETHMSRAVRNFTSAIQNGEMSHPGDRNELSRTFTAHIGAAQRREIPSVRDEDGRPLWVLMKERPDSPHPINAAQAAVIGWQARLDALKDGADAPVIWTAV